MKPRKTLKRMGVLRNVTDGWDPERVRRRGAIVNAQRAVAHDHHLRCVGIKTP
jgi:hypothetical protein